MKLNMLTISIGIPLALILIPWLGITGVIFVTIVAGIPSMFIGLYWTWKRYGTKADFRASAKILMASGISAFATYLFLSLVSTAAWIMLTIGVTLFLATYLITAPLIGALNQKDIDNLRAMFSGLGIMSRLLEIPLTLLEKPLKTRHQQTEISKQ
jgi:peptidoglycan biosynthesis protein MviN/MurJ (putative lipid II flippase)